MRKQVIFAAAIFLSLTSKGMATFYECPTYPTTLKDSGLVFSATRIPLVDEVTLKKTSPGGYTMSCKYHLEPMTWKAQITTPPGQKCELSTGKQEGRCIGSYCSVSCF